MHRRWVDPMAPFAAVVAQPAHGVVVTSATLTEGAGIDPIADADALWSTAETRSGARHLARPAIRAAVPSPFDYPAQTRIYVVTDVRKDDLDQVAAAYRSLFLAAGGGGLGLFTAVSRLRHVHRRIAGPLDEAGLPLLAQHVDPIDAGTLVDIFRDDPSTSLLGTDALRDGVDVPGNSLRLVVMERVPWPRPTVLHAARRMAGGGSAYDDRVVRARLAQAFGRLIRRDSDRGILVILSAAMPSRLLTAFPAEVLIRRLPLDQAIARVTEQLALVETVQPELVR
jgi:ATP-dependent DNA helicase DinG